MGGVKQEYLCDVFEYHTDCQTVFVDDYFNRITWALEDALEHELIDLEYAHFLSYEPVCAVEWIGENMGIVI